MSDKPARSSVRCWRTRSSTCGCCPCRTCTRRATCTGAGCSVPHWDPALFVRSWKGAGSLGSPLLGMQCPCRTMLTISLGGIGLVPSGSAPNPLHAGTLWWTWRWRQPQASSSPPHQTALSNSGRSRWAGNLAMTACRSGCKQARGYLQLQRQHLPACQACALIGYATRPASSVLSSMSRAA